MWARKNWKELVAAAGGICISEDWDGGGLRNWNKLGFLAWESGRKFSLEVEALKKARISRRGKEQTEKGCWGSPQQFSLQQSLRQRMRS